MGMEHCLYPGEPLPKGMTEADVECVIIVEPIRDSFGAWPFPEPLLAAAMLLCVAGVVLLAWSRLQQGGN